MSKNVRIPPELRSMLVEFCVNVLRDQPEDIVKYAADYFNKLNGRNDSDDGSDMETRSMDMDNWDDDEEVIAPPPRSCRRKSVAAERYNPEEDYDEEDDYPVHAKSDVQRARLKASIQAIFMFKSLEIEGIMRIIDAMFEVKVTSGEEVIKQGDAGDNFYIIESGTYEIKVGDEVVVTLENEGSFGELALIYNTPRAATVIAKTEGSLWAMDGKSFRKFVVQAAFKKRERFTKLIEEMPLLQALNTYEKMQLADALETQICEDGEVIITQGEEGTNMYFIESGSVIIYATHEGVEKEVCTLEKGAYFGERALLTKDVRAASAKASGMVKLAKLDVDAFIRILGPCIAIMRRDVANYQEQMANVFDEENCV